MPLHSPDSLLHVAHTVFSGRGTQALLLGSGTSRSALIPTGWDVTLDLVRQVGALQGEAAIGDAEAWYSDKFGEAPDYSRLLKMLARTPAERRALLHAYFEPAEDDREKGAKVPTPAHRAIAKLVVGGYIKVILTTNFDRLIETALRDAGVEPTVISTADAAEGAAPIVHQGCVVVKLHGDYLDDRIKNTTEELETYDHRMDAYLDRILDEFGLIVCGWSGEWDPALRAALERCKSRRYSAFWASIGPPGPLAAKVVAQRAAQEIRIVGADQFFKELAEKVQSLEELRSSHPLTLPVAVATLKRYISEDRYRVRLEDLVREEAVHVAGRLSIDFPLQGGTPPTAESGAARLRQMDSVTETLRHLFFHGCRHANLAQHDVFLRAIQLLGSTGDNNGAWAFYIDMTSYPMAATLYSAALGALANRNWLLLRQLLTLRLASQGNERLACDRLAACSAAPEPAAQALHVERLKTPLNIHFAALLGSMAKGIVPDPDDLFDEVEVMTALCYLDLVRDLSVEPIWMPPGRYCWRGSQSGISIVARLFRVAETEGAAWAPLKAGWFGGKVNRFTQVREAFQATLTQFATAYW